MIKILLLIIISFNFSYCENIKKQYRIYFKSDNKIKNVRVELEEKNKNLEDLKNSDTLEINDFDNNLTFDILKSDIVKIEYIENKPKKINTELKPQEEEKTIQEPLKIDNKDINTNINYKLIFFILIILFLTYYLYKQFSILGKKEEEIKEINKPKIKAKRTKPRETNNKPLNLFKTPIKEDNKTTENNETNEVLTFYELETKRVEIYKELKYKKDIEKETKKELYKKISILKTKIKNKEDLNELNNELNSIIKGVENGTN
ncbi:MAG: hypothetical protein ACNI28_10310 [Arcobacter sp.]|uniref:hypothetical protein n=1 Tax=Arcobacter sp. TaxID=1872629 RepID=UPI003AFF6FE4